MIDEDGLAIREVLTHNRKSEAGIATAATLEERMRAG
jgi:hypothetical protein